jgi:uncharacterized protein (UPF0254 family)
MKVSECVVTRKLAIMAVSEAGSRGEEVVVLISEDVLTLVMMIAVFVRIAPNFEVGTTAGAARVRIWIDDARDTLVIAHHADITATGQDNLHHLGEAVVVEYSSIVVE